MGDESLAALDRTGVAIEGGHLGTPLEDGVGVAAGTERAVDMALAGHRGEAVDHFVEQHGDMRLGRGAHSVTPLAWHRYSPISRSMGSACASFIRRSGAQMSKVSPLP